jgi:type IV secretory pathway VirB2 component (pilin)
MKKIAFYIVFFVLFLEVVAAAATGNDTLGRNAGIEDYLCHVLEFLTGGLGKSIAAFACIGISLGFITGKLQWSTVLTFALGIACIFGAPQVIKAFTGSSTAVCEDV